MSGRRGLLPDVPGLFCLLGFVGLVFLGGGKRALQCADAFWHIKAGSVMLDQGTILTSDIFSHTAAGTPWLSHEWLAEVVMGALHQMAGLPGVVLFYLLLASLTFWILAVIVRERTGDWLALVVISITALLAHTHLLARPHLFSWFFGAVTFYVLMRGGRLLFVLPLMTILWVNLHGGFILGLVLQGIFLLGSVLDKWFATTERFGLREALREFRLPLLALGLSVAAVGLNPSGYQLLTFFFHATKPVFLEGISEWRAPNLQYYWYVRFYLVGILFMLLVSPVRVSWRDRLLVVLFINAALTSSRNISVMALFLAPFLGDVLKPWGAKVALIMKKRSSEDGLILSSVSGPVATLVLAGVFFVVLSISSDRAAWASRAFFAPPEYYSAAAVQYVQENMPDGLLYNEYSQGGYLLYAVDPPPKVFIDGRADMYGEDLFSDYKKIARMEEDPEELLAAYGIEWVYFTAKSPLVLYLKRTRNWESVFEDEHVAVLIRTNDELGR